MLADIYTGSDGSKPECLTMFNGRLYFSAEDGTYGKELWVYEHYYAPNIVADIRNGISGSNPGDLTVFNN
jgi:ELWxxDGT repeat protein